MLNELRAKGSLFHAQIVCAKMYISRSQKHCKNYFEKTTGVWQVLSACRGAEIQVDIRRVVLYIHTFGLRKTFYPSMT